MTTHPSESRRWFSSRARRHLLLVVLAALATGAAWASIVPPFEGPDELFFYNRARDLALHPQRREGLFYRLAAPVVRALASTDEPAVARYYPGFRFIGNARGQVNRFVHERPVARQEHVRTLVALRGLVIVLSALTLVAIYSTALLALGSESAALAVSGICLFIPQYSFMNAVVHPEAVTRLLGAIVSLLVVARATRRIPKWLAWGALFVAIAMVPLADRQAFFLVPFALAAIVLTESGWRSRAATAAIFVVPGVLATWLVLKYVEDASALLRWLAVLRHPLGVLMYRDAGRGSIPPERAYYFFEFIPKLFMGFWGWLGQPSLLLPAWVYAAFAILAFTAAAGLAVGAVRRLRGQVVRPALADEDRQRLLARRLLALGIAIMCVPILYSPALEGRNLWYGRWLFAMLGPIAIWLWIGLSEIRAAIGRSPSRSAAILAAVAGIAGVLWITSAGDTFRAGVAANHYGDQDRLIRTARDFVAGLGLAALVVACLSRIRLKGTPVSPGVATFTVAALLNGLLLAAFVRPVYLPMSDEDYVASIAGAVSEGDLDRAAALYASAVKSYPESSRVRGLVDAVPRLLLGTSLDEMSGLLQEHIAKGKGIADRDLLLALARALPSSDLSASTVLRTALDEAARDPGLAEPVALVRLTLDRREGDPDAAAQLIGAGGGAVMKLPMRKGEAILEGFTVKRMPSGRTQIVVYFRPGTDWANRALWLHAYPIGSDQFLDVAAVTGRAVPLARTLAWAVFELPPGQFNVFTGVTVGNDGGPGYGIGLIPS